MKGDPTLVESGKLPIRIEAFIDRTNFGIPGLQALAGSPQNVNDPVTSERPLASPERIRSTTTSSRQIQIALRLSF